MMAENNLDIKRLTPSEVTRLFSGMSPAQATRYYNKCMTNPKTPQENVNLLMQFRSQNADRFLSEDQMKGSRRSKGSWVDGRGLSGGYQDRSNGRMYVDGYSYDNRGRSYDPYGNEIGGFRDGGPDFQYRRDAGYSHGNLFRGGRSKRSVTQARSVDELASTVSGMRDPIRGRLYLEKIIDNPESHPDTVANAKLFIEQGSAFIAGDEDIRLFRESREGRKSTGMLGRRGRRPVTDARSPEDVAATVSGLRSNVARTRYFDKVISNPDSNIQTVDNLIAFRNANQHLFASDEEVASAPRTGRFRFWKTDNELAEMSPKKKGFFFKVKYSGNRSSNTAYGLRVMTNPDTPAEDKQAMTEVVNENPGLFFRSAGRTRQRY